MAHFSQVDISKFLPREKYTIVNEERNKLIVKELNDHETKQLQLFHDLLKTDFPHDVQDTVSLVRFLRARKWDLKESEKMYRARMKWINEFQPHKITEKDPNLVEEIKAGKAFWFGRDDRGRPILVYRAAYHFPNYKNIEDAFRFLVLLTEIGLNLLPPPPNNQIIAIYDKRGFSMRKNTDMKLFTMATSLAHYYPESLGSVYIVGADWFFQSLWAIAVKIIDPITVKKINMLSSNENEAIKELQKTLGESALAPFLGGDPKKLKKGHLPLLTPDELVYGGNNSKAEIVSQEECEKVVQQAEQEITPVLTGNPAHHFSAEQLDLD